MTILTLEIFDYVIATLSESVGNEYGDEVSEKVASIIEELRGFQVELVKELLTMYESASEHNVDINREAILELAERISQISTSTSTSTSTPTHE